jgi:hypothetical protein
MTGSDCGLIEVLSQHLPQRIEESQKNLPSLQKIRTESLRKKVHSVIVLKHCSAVGVVNFNLLFQYPPTVPKENHEELM